jgi:glyoxylase-like metal-dependent hydrolase (beta-lactamase superfamily II)
MDKIEVPQDQVVGMEAIAPGVEGLRIAFVNVFGIVHSQGWTLIDAALPLSANRIRHWAEEKFSGAPNAIVLTHGHFDHVSAAAELAEHWNVPIYAHTLEFPYLIGKAEYPAPNPAAGGGLMSLLSPTLPRGPIDVGNRLRALPDDGELVHELPGWRLLQTPGHTPGHVSFFREQDRVLLPGDAFCTTKAESFFDAAIVQPAELHGPPAYFTSDWNAACESVEKLAKLEPYIVAPGHGKPLAGDGVAVALKRLAADFVRIAVPDSAKA